MGKEAKLGQLEAVSQIRSFLAQRGLQIPSRGIRVMNEENWLVLGAALGRIAMLDKPVRTGKQFCPYRTDVLRIATMNGHRVKLVRETGET